MRAGKGSRVQSHVQSSVFYQQIENGNMANQIHGFTLDYGKFILIVVNLQIHCLSNTSSKSAM